jgi:ribonuclease Z
VRLEDLGDVLRIGPGQKVAYVTDAAWTPDNLAKIVNLAAGAEQLFIEAAFLEADAGLAAARSHLTAAQAGRIGRLAGARHLVPFHFSPRYLGQPEALHEEALRAFSS